jgi:hypothetical protein
MGNAGARSNPDATDDAVVLRPQRPPPGLGILAGSQSSPGAQRCRAAQTVSGAPLETLEALHAKSLIRHREQIDGTTRLVMLETLPQFALEESADCADLEETRRLHCAYYLTLVEEFAAKFRTHDEAPALDALDRDIDNIRSGLTWALAAEPGQALRLAGLLGDYWFTHDDPGGLEWLDSALTAAGNQAPAGDRARAHLNAPFSSMFAGNGRQPSTPPHLRSSSIERRTMTTVSPPRTSRCRGKDCGLGSTPKRERTRRRRVPMLGPPTMQHYSAGRSAGWRHSLRGLGYLACSSAPHGC